MSNAIPVPAGFWPHDAAAEDRRARAEAAGLDDCIACARGVREGKGWVVEIIDGGSQIARPGTADEKEPGYMGFFVIGPECGKKVPEDFRASA